MSTDQSRITEATSRSQSKWMSMHAFNLWHTLNARRGVAGDASYQHSPTQTHTHTLLLWFTTSLVSILMGINWHNRYEASYKLQTRITLNLITFTAQKIYFPRTVTSHTRVSHKRTWSVCRVRIRGIANGVRFRFNDSWKSLASLSPSGGNASDIDVVILWIFCAKRTFNSILLLYMFDEWKITCTEIIFYSNVRHKIRDAATLLYPS